LQNTRIRLGRESGSDFCSCDVERIPAAAADGMDKSLPGVSWARW